MHDQRVTFLRGALDELVDSLDATVRIQRWVGTDPVPEPLRRDAQLLVERLGLANKLALDKASGTPRVVTAMNSLSGAILRLEAAFAKYQRSLSEPEADGAAPDLDAELELARAELERQ